MFRCMHRTNIYLDEAQTRALHGLAADEGTSSAEIIGRLLTRALAGAHADGPADIDAIENSFGALNDVEGAARGEDGRSAHLDRLWRLNP